MAIEELVACSSAIIACRLKQAQIVGGGYGFWVTSKAPPVGFVGVTVELTNASGWSLPTPTKFTTVKKLLDALEELVSAFRGTRRSVKNSLCCSESCSSVEGVLVRLEGLIACDRQFIGKAYRSCTQPAPEPGRCVKVKGWRCRVFKSVRSSSSREEEAPRRPQSNQPGRCAGFLEECTK